MANGTITAPKGFTAAGLISGIKVSGKPDLGLIVCEQGATAAAVFTTNSIVSAAVQVCREHAKSNVIKAVVVNSGNANACTGNKGFKDAVRMCQETAKQLGADPHEVLVASTGIIGEPMPMDKVVAGIQRAVTELSDKRTAGQAFTRAIMTTDTKPKQAVRSLDISGETVHTRGNHQRSRHDWA